MRSIRAVMATRLMDDGDEEETLGGDGDDDGVGERESNKDICSVLILEYVS